jgi:hypothetical protein
MCVMANSICVCMCVLHMYRQITTNLHTDPKPHQDAHQQGNSRQQDAASRQKDDRYDNNQHTNSAGKHLRDGGNRRQTGAIMPRTESGFSADSDSGRDHFDGDDNMAGDAGAHQNAKYYMQPSNRKDTAASLGRNAGVCAYVYVYACMYVCMYE